MFIIEKSTKDMNAKFIEDTLKKIPSLIINQRKQVSNKFGFNPYIVNN